jgi:hypothetical protein
MLCYRPSTALSVKIQVKNWVTLFLRRYVVCLCEFYAEKWQKKKDGRLTIR